MGSAARIIRSAFPPIDLLQDIADVADWPLLISAEQKTNPRVITSIGISISFQSSAGSAAMAHPT